jgi:hypothetical protein
MNHDTSNSFGTPNTLKKWFIRKTTKAAASAKRHDLNSHTGIDAALSHSTKGFIIRFGSSKKPVKC